MLWNHICQHMCHKTPAARDTRKSRTKEQLLHHVLGDVAINKIKQTYSKRLFRDFKVEMSTVDFQGGACKIEHFPPISGHGRGLSRIVCALRSPEPKISPSLLAPFFFFFLIQQVSSHVLLLSAWKTRQYSSINLNHEGYL